MDMTKILKWACIIGGAIVVIVIGVTVATAPDYKAVEPYCSKGDAWLYAQQAVEGVLKNPDEADFHNAMSWPVEEDPSVPGQYIVTGQVTATNSFNAKIKQTFTAVVRCDKGTWYTGKVIFL